MSLGACTTCGEELGRYGHFVRTADGARHYACAPRPTSPPPIAEDLSLYEAAVAPTPAAPPPQPIRVAAPVARAVDPSRCIRCGQTFGEFGRDFAVFRETPKGRHHRRCPRKSLTPPAPSPALRCAPPAAPAQPRAEIAEVEIDDSRERCVRCGRGLGSVGYWIGTAAGKQHSVCPAPVRVVASATPEEVF